MKNKKNRSFSSDPSQASTTATTVMPYRRQQQGGGGGGLANKRIKSTESRAEETRNTLHGYITLKSGKIITYPDWVWLRQLKKKGSLSKLALMRQGFSNDVIDRLIDLGFLVGDEHPVKRVYKVSDDIPE